MQKVTTLNLLLLLISSGSQGYGIMTRVRVMVGLVVPRGVQWEFRLTVEV